MAPISASKCPYMSAKPAEAAAKSEPPKLNLKSLRPAQPIDYDYAEELKKLNVEELTKDIVATLKDSQDWWPADYGHYGPFMVRLAWHSAGTYRVFDGRGGARGGNIRFSPLDSWPDNGNLDKAKRLLWPIKQKYGKSLSWGDLMIYTANVGMEDMGFETAGFAFGRKDIWALEEDIYWGGEEAWLDDSKRHNGASPPVAADLEKPLGASQMGLIYVNPTGPGGNSDPQGSAHHIRETFARMAMNDEETAALIVGGHTFGKGHGAAPGSNNGDEPQLAPIEQQGFGWANKFGTGKGCDAITSGLEGAWTTAPTKWDNGYLTNLYKFEWELQKAPSGDPLWRPKENGGAGSVPDAHVASKSHQPIMYTSDIALRTDPEYTKITRRWLENPEEMKVAFQKAWFKLTHRDMGCPERYLGPLAPKTQGSVGNPFIWQDPVPVGKSDGNVDSLKAAVQGAGTVAALVRVAWTSAATFRQTDLRGGANGARIRLAPQKDWEMNNPAELAGVLAKLTEISASTGNSIADLIVLAGSAALGQPFEMQFGRGDATQEMTDVGSFNYLKTVADGFLNYNHPSPHQLVDRACLLGLTTSEMTVLYGGLRALGVTCNDEAGRPLGVLTKQPGTLSNDFFVNLLSMNTEWKKTGWGVYEGKDRKSGSFVWCASECDLVFGSNAELRAIAEYYAQSNSDFVKDFTKAWAKVMNADRV